MSDIPYEDDIPVWLKPIQDELTEREREYAETLKRNNTNKTKKRHEQNDESLSDEKERTKREER